MSGQPPPYPDEKGGYPPPGSYPPPGQPPPPAGEAMSLLYNFSEPIHFQKIQVQINK